MIRKIIKTKEKEISESDDNGYDVFVTNEADGSKNNTDGLTERSEEVADIIERFPTGWTNIISVIMTVVVLVTLFLAFFIKYPDTVSGQLIITGQQAPVRIVSSIDGRLHLCIPNKAVVHMGQCVGYIESGARYDDIMQLDSICGIKLRPDVGIDLPDSLNLGALSARYNDFALAYTQYDQLRNTKVYENMRKMLEIRKHSAQLIVDNLQKKAILHNKALVDIERQYFGDSMLYIKGAISQEDLEVKRSNLLSLRLSGIEYNVQKMSKISEINSMDTELAEIDITVEEDLRSAYNTLVAKRNVLDDELQQWKQRYLFISPIDGVLEYLGFWRENVFVPSAQELFSVAPANNVMIGELNMSVNGAGKVREGQDVNVKLADFPYREYGYIRGKVYSVSKLTRNLETTEGITKAYLVVVSFPDGLVTNFGKKLSLNYEAIGNGEIITKKRRLIERLFDNLKINTEK